MGNTIEMQTITAIAHLRACILYLIDVSEECGSTIKQQVALFHSIKTLFHDKCITVVCNKIDIFQLDRLSLDNRKYLKTLSLEALRISKSEPISENDKSKISLLFMSTLTEIGVKEVKDKACSMLLQKRVTLNFKVKKICEILKKIQLKKSTENLIKPYIKPRYKFLNIKFASTKMLLEIKKLKIKNKV